MLEMQGNIWDYHDQGWIVIPTNKQIKKSDSTAVMGAGLARQAAERFPQLPRLLGDYLQIGSDVSYYTEFRLFCFPTKDHWRDESSIDLIRFGCSTLVTQSRNIEKIFLPALGCGLGGLFWEDVKPVMAEMLPGDKFVVVLREEQL